MVQSLRAIATTGPEAYSSDGNRTQFCVDYWAETFFGSCEPSIWTRPSSPSS